MNKAVSHRGRGTGLTDNTIEAFQSAQELKFQMVELDLRKTSDNHIIIHHDETINNKPMRNLTLKETLQEARNVNLHIDTLEELLNTLKNTITYNIEIKESGYENLILQQTLKHITHNDFIITSFQIETLKTFRALDPQVKLGLILDKTDLTNTFYSTIKNNLSIHKTAKAKIDAIIANKDLFFFNFINRTVKHGMQLYVWNVTSQEEYNKYNKDPRVTKIIVDHPYHINVKA